VALDVAAPARRRSKRRARPFSDHEIEISGLRIAYTLWDGDPDRTVILVHGLGSNRKTWNPIVDRMRPELRVLAPDLRGHGDSDWTREGYRLDQFVADLQGFSTQLAGPRFDLVGHSLGGRIAIAYAGQYRNSLRRLVISDQGPEVSREGAIKVRDRRGAHLNAKGLRTRKAALDTVRSMNPEWKAFWYPIYVDTMYRKNWAGRLVEKSDPDLVWITGSLSLKDVPQLWKLASRIKAPTRLLWGRKSHLLTADIVERMKRTIPNLEVVEFDTGHYIQREQVGPYSRAVDEFLAAGHAGGLAKKSRPRE
jgi:pimeloyl-ACP methyl ester carboxylesterase